MIAAGHWGYGATALARLVSESEFARAPESSTCEARCAFHGCFAVGERRARESPGVRQALAREQHFGNAMESCKVAAVHDRDTPRGKGAEVGGMLGLEQSAPGLDR